MADEHTYRRKKVDAVTYRPGERVTLSIITRGDNQLVGYDVEPA